MAINIRCSCGGEAKLKTKVCPRCDTPFPKKGRKYKVSVRMNGKKVTRTVTNLELAKEIEAKLKVDIAKGEFNIQRKRAPLLHDVWKRFLPWAQEHKKSWKSDMYNYQKHLQPIFEKKQLDRISSFDVERLKMNMKQGKNMHNKSYAPATIKHVIVLLSRLYTVAGQWGMYDGMNPCDKVAKPKLNNQVTEFLNDMQLTNLLEVLENWPKYSDAAFIKILLYTGLRRGELFKLSWQDINLERQTVILRDPKGKQDETLPLSNKACAVLRKLLPTESPYVFPGKHGGRRVDFKRPWIEIKKKAGLPQDFRLHGLRHHYASSLVSAGVDLYTVSKLLTHKDTKTTQRYAHLADQALRDAVNLSDNLQTAQQPKILKIVGGQNG
ncbi:MAG: site-specific integrase [Candidatus Electrothrix aestuarii]|uniref:Site-specific integrase n=1 Tax=Candidatus Electrothrix aestuarii TaxID=3062594 RepID=A0AAU8LW51_9BACT